MRELDNSLHALWESDGEPIRFDSMGGRGEMPRAVEGRTNGLPYRPRLVAIIDSDRKGPGDGESANARRLRQVCDEHGLPCWVLAKREAENYLPGVLLAARRDAGAECFRRVEGLGETQRGTEGLLRHEARPAGYALGGRGESVRTACRRPTGRLSPPVSERTCMNAGTCGMRERSGTNCGPAGGGDLEHGIELIRREL